MKALRDRIGNRRDAPLRPALRRTAIAAAAAALLGGVVLAGPAAHADPVGSAYFVDCSATGGDGTASAPWSTLAQVDSHGAYAPGDVIMLRRGTTCRGQLLLTGSGTAQDRIVLGTWGDPRKPDPVVSGGGTAEGTGAVQLTDAEYWTIQDLQVTNSANSKTNRTHRSGVMILNASAGRLHGIVVQRLSVKDVTSYPWVRNGAPPHQFGGISALTTSGLPDAGFDGLRILNNTVDHVGRSGIVEWNRQNTSSRDSDSRISGNRVTWALGDGILVGGARYSRIDHDVAAHSSNLPSCPKSICADTRDTASAGIWPIFSDHIRIDHDEAYDTRWGPGDGEGFDIDASATDVVFEDNYSHDNEGGGILLCGSVRATLRFNILQNNGKSAIAFIGTMPAKATSIYNNTIYQSKRSKAGAVRTFGGHRGSDITFFNNVVYNYGNGDWGWPTSVRSRSNTYVGVHRTGEPHGSGYSWKNPGLKKPGAGRTGASSLQGYRPAHPKTFRTGSAIPKEVTTDFFGKRIDPKRPPRGAAG